jgi:hypothetical protein
MTFRVSWRKNIREAIRTAGVIAGGMVSIKLLSMLLVIVLLPWLARGPDRALPLNPLVGLAVGFLVGSLQKSRPGLIAAVCWIPDLFHSLVFHSLTEYAYIRADKVIAVACSSLAAYAVWHWRTSRITAQVDEIAR